MKKNNGFTLMELVGVIVIIGIVLGIAVPRIAEYMKKGTNEYYYSLEKEMKFSGMDYAETYRSLLPRQINNVTVINLEELVNNKYIDTVRDEEGNVCTGRVTIKKVKKDGYEYYSCLECGNNYNTTGESCEYDEKDNEYVGGDNYDIGIGGETCDKNCTLNCDNNNDGVCDRNCDTDNDGKCELNCDNNKDCVCDLNCDTNGDGKCDKNCDDDGDGICDRNCDGGSSDIIAGGYVVVEQGKKYELPLGDIYYNGELLEEKVTPSPNKIDTDRLGKTTVVYYYHGVKKELIVEVVDKTKPSKPEIVLKYNNNKGSSYLGEWYSGKIYQQYKSTDYTKKGVLGSGIKEYQISADNKNFTSLDNNYQISTENGSYKYYVRSIDNNNNISDVNSYNYKIDTEIPTCELEVKEGSKTDNSTKWYTTNIKVGFKKITETVSSIRTQIIDIPSITNNVEDQVVTGIVTDQAGNTSTCSITVSVDKDTPTISAKETDTYIMEGTSNNPASYFNISYSISKGSPSCILDSTGQTISNVNELPLGVNQVTCTATGGNGKQVSAKTTFRHKYYAKVNCKDGRTVSGADCTYYYVNNEYQCGCAQWKSCANEGACGCKQIKCTLYKSCTLCTTYCVGNCSSSPYPSRPNGSGCTVIGGSTSGTSGYGIVSCCTSGRQAGCGSEVVYGSACNNAQSKVCAEANTCVSEACGCQTGNSCTKTENGYRYYTCHKTGNTGNQGSGSSSNSICTF